MHALFCFFYQHVSQRSTFFTSSLTPQGTAVFVHALPMKRQKSSWQFWSFCHIHQPCLWCHWCRLLGTKCQHSQLCFNMFVLVVCIDSETILPRNIPTGWRWQWKRDAAATESRGCSFAGTVTETGRCHSCIVCCTGGTVALHWLYHCCRRWIACCTGSAVILCWLYWVYSYSILTSCFRVCHRWTLWRRECRTPWMLRRGGGITTGTRRGWAFPAGCSLWGSRAAGRGCCWLPLSVEQL